MKTFKANKKVKYTINGALIGGFINVFINMVNQINNEDDSIFDWQEFIEAGAKGAFIGSLSGLAIGTIKDHDMSKVLLAAGGSLGVLKESLNKHVDNDTTLPFKAKDIQLKLYNKFKNDLSEYPSINGSIQKGTSIQNSDIDIQVKFNKNSSSIENVRTIIDKYFNDNFHDKHLVKIRSQNHSIGLFFEIKGEEKRIDIVPMREIENGRGDTYLYSKKRNSIKKTNSQKHIINLKFTAKQKKIIKLLKGWKIENDISMPSILIELIVKKAFESSIIPRGLDKTLLYIIKYISENITSIRIIDSANSNNIISDTLSLNQKEQIQIFCIKMLKDINKDERNILDYFNN